MTQRGLIRILPLLALLLAGGCATTGSDLRSEHDANDVAEANMRLGVAYMQDGNFEKALEKLERARRADPEYPMAYNMLGLLHQRMGVYDKAEANFEKALGLAPKQPNILNNYGQFLCGQDRFEEAEAAFVKASENPLNNNPARALTNAGTCASVSGHTDKAEQYYRKALERNPEQPLALLQMAELQYQSEEYLSARGYLQRYANVARHSASSLWLGIRIEDKLGDKDAVSSYALSLKSNFPDSDQVRLLRESGIR